jgi:type I restriction enzyme S subunit
VPKRRFPEFQGAAPWHMITLGEASIPVTERVGIRKLTPVSISAGIGFVPQAEKFGRDISGNQYQLYTLVRDGDFVYNKGNSLKFPEGCVYLLKGWEQVAAPNVFICFRLKDGYSNGFFQNCFEANAHGRKLKRHITSGARSNGLLNISKDAFFGVEIPTPTWAEQQKIADCLSSVDELIVAQAHKVDALKTHKKGLMQQLFPREGETQPRLRFSEFDTLWIRGLLGQLATTVMGNAFKSADFVESGIQILRIGNLYQGELQLNRSPVYLSDFQAENNHRFLVNPLDLLMSMTGTVGKEDYGFVVRVPMGAPLLLLNQRVMKLVPIQGCDIGFLLQLLKDEILLDQLYTLPGGTKQANLSSQDVKGLVVCYPCQAEQEKIADCLTSLDNLITAATQELEALKTHKKGLMQQLFPSAEAVET